MSERRINWRMSGEEFSQAVSAAEDKALTPGDPDKTRKLLESIKNNPVKRGPRPKNNPKPNA